MRSRLIIIILSIILIQSCASIVGFEEGRTVGEEGLQFKGSLNYTALPTETFDLDLGENTLGFPNIELGIKYGVMEDLDLGIRISSNLNAGFLAKYQLLGDKSSKSAFSVGGEVLFVGGLSYSLSVPVFFSYYPQPNIAVNLSPRYIYQSPLFTEGSYNYFGGNAGIHFGTVNKFGIDIGYYLVDNLIGLRRTVPSLSFGVGGILMINTQKTTPKDLSEKRRNRRRRN